MSLLFVDGFDHYEDAKLKWTVPQVLTIPLFTTGRCGGQALEKQQQNGAGINKALGTQRDLVVGMAVYTGDDNITYGIPEGEDEAVGTRETLFPADDLLTFKDSAGTVILTLKMVKIGAEFFAPTGRLEIVSPVAGLVAAASVNNFATWSTEQWQYIQVKYHPNGTSGTVEVVDGTGSLLFRSTGKTTNEADNDVANIELMGTLTNARGYRIDDLYVLNSEGAVNNDFLGDVRVTPFAMRSILAQQSTGVLTDINEEVMELENFISMGVIGELDNYEVEGFICHGFTPSSVKGIQYNLGAAKDNSGIIKYQHRVNSVDSGVDVVAQTFAGGNFGIDSRTYDTDPADSLVWTEAKIEALEVGFKLTTREGGA